MSSDDELGSMASLLQAVASTGGTSALATGTMVGGQYRVERPIGEGGMGVVYLARDIRLGRDVAVKLGTAVSNTALRRIEREAKALARLSHPNVVVVYQVGELDGRVYIVMEHVDGGTARDWLAARPRSWREIVALYAAAGDGLAAAHAADLIHRDFKPDNVLVGGDGRPRVADFGLARAAGADEPSPGPESGVVTLTTQAGAVVGTPAYMPPEQLAGDDLDARADQFAFAAALWEALLGTRPFDGRTPAEVKARIESQAPAPGVEASGRRVPRHLVTALRRALAPERDDRWPDVPALLGELRRDPNARRRRIGLAAGGLALAGAAVTGVLAFTPAATPAPCGDGASRMSPVWSPERRAALARRAGGLAWTAIEPRLENRAQLWIAEYTGTCRDARVTHSISDTAFDRRMTCLDERQAELHEVMLALETGSTAAAEAAPLQLDSLPVPEMCRREPQSAGEDPQPTDAASRRKLDATIAPMAAAEAASLDRALLDPLGRTATALEAARAAGWEPRIARALALRASVLNEMGKPEEARAAYEEAAHLAVKSKSDHLAVQVMSDLATVLADLRTTGEADRALDTARALWERTGRPADTGQRLFGAIAHVAVAKGEPEAALAATRKHVELATQAFGDVPWSQADNHFNLSIALAATGDHVHAVEEASRAVELATQAYGDHPTVARMRAQVAILALKRGDLDAALSQAEAGLATFERWYGPDDHRLRGTLQIAGDVHRQRGELDQAAAFMTRSAAILRRTDPSSVELPEEEANLAIIAVSGGKFEEAAARGTAALTAMEAIHGTDAAELINVLVLLGYVARERPAPDLEASQRHLERARQLAGTHRGPTHAETLNSDIELSHTLVKQGHATDAVNRLSPWLQRLESPSLSRTQGPELRFALAEALAAAGNPQRACALAGQAADGYRAIDLPPMLAQVTTWRGTHCGRRPR